jgi:hypothetical protein
MPHAAARLSVGRHHALFAPSVALCYDRTEIRLYRGDGVSGIISHFPERDITVTLLSSTEHGVWDPARKIHEMVLDGQMT